MQGDAGPESGPPTSAEASAPSSAPERAPVEIDESGDPFAVASAAFEAATAEAGTRDEATPVEGEPPPAPPAPVDELAQLRAENERLRAERQPAPPQAPPEVLAVRRFVGLDPIYEEGPTLEQVSRMIDARDYGGLNNIKRPDGTYGYSLEEAIDLKTELGQRQGILDASARVMHGAAWGAIGQAFDQAVKDTGLDPAEVKAAAESAGDPLGITAVYLQRIVDAARKSGRDEGSKEWKARHDGLKNEYEAFKASAAGNAPALESGGRGRGRGSLAAALALPDEEFAERAIRGEFAGLDMRGGG